MVAFLWPTKAGGFGGKIKMGKVADLKAEIEKANGFLYKPEARAWITEYPDSALPKAERQYSETSSSAWRTG
jgi:cytochrome b6-f complex iron-sulfur subunit